MNIQLTIEKDTVIIEVTGSLFVNESTILREKMIEQINLGRVNFLLDVSKLKFIDSSGLGVLVSIHKRVKENKGKLIIKGLDGEVKNVFELTRLTKVFEIID